ncbi:MAG TPA: hypothetical protein VIW24_11170 [Aldersonia sp.]
MNRVRVVVGIAAVVSVGFAAPATADTPPLDNATTLQVPGTIVGWPLTRGAAVFNSVVQHGHGRIAAPPTGYGDVRWVNLSTGSSGVVNDTSPDRHAVITGAGQVVVVVTPRPRDLVDVFGTPSVGTFYVTP